MRIAFFSTHGFDREAFERIAPSRHEITYLVERLDVATAERARGHEAVCCFASDVLGAATLERLATHGVRLVLLRSAGFDHVDVAAAARLSIPVLRVPAYSPESIAEHAFALLLALVRRIPRAHARFHEGNFALEGLVGTVLRGRTFGIFGTGNIGAAAARIARGFGCRVIAHDLAPDPVREVVAGVSYTDFAELLRASDILSLHVPLTPATRRVIDAAALAAMRPGSILVNTARGGLVDTAALVEALRRKHLGGAALDVYEGEGGLYFRDHSLSGIRDELLLSLTALPNVVVTAHQGFLTDEALATIAATTLSNADAFEAKARPLPNAVNPGSPRPHRP
jgi:D-lactate dehydrogenase